MPWTVNLLSKPDTFCWKSDYFPRTFRYKKTALELRSKVIGLGGEAEVVWGSRKKADRPSDSPPLSETVRVGDILTHRNGRKYLVAAKHKDYIFLAPLYHDTNNAEIVGGKVTVIPVEPANLEEFLVK